MSSRDLLDLLPRREAWMVDAACRGMDPALFIPHRGDMDTCDQAKAVCRGCPVVAPCLEYGMRFGRSEIGIFGGTSHRERRRITTERNRRAS